LAGSAAILAATFGILPNGRKERAWKGQILCRRMSAVGASGFRLGAPCALHCGRMPQAAGGDAGAPHKYSALGRWSR